MSDETSDASFCVFCVFGGISANGEPVSNPYSTLDDSPLVSGSNRICLNQPIPSPNPRLHIALLIASQAVSLGSRTEGHCKVWGLTFHESPEASCHDRLVRFICYS